MSNNTYSSTRDVTGQQAAPSPGMSMYQLFLCGHRASSTGAKFRRVPGLTPIAWRCAACAKAKA